MCRSQADSVSIGGGSQGWRSSEAATNHDYGMLYRSCFRTFRCCFKHSVAASNIHARTGAGKGFCGSSAGRLPASVAVCGRLDASKGVPSRGLSRGLLAPPHVRTHARTRTHTPLHNHPRELCFRTPPALQPTQSPAPFTYGTVCQ